MARPVGATIVYIIMAIASIWWLTLGFLFFFGNFWFWYAGFPFAWLWGIIYGIAGFVGLGLAGGLAAGYRQAYSTTLLLAILFLVFSIPAWFTGYGIGGAVLSAVVLVLLLVPSVKKFYTQ
ncbi:MAG: hypothetical protein ACFCUE_05130 [Candidatus Bathyarchaeia archaeon]